MRVSIVGLGLIGGSMGLALRGRQADVEVVGFARRREVAFRAVELGAVDRAEEHLLSAVDAADLVLLATPVMAMKDVMEAMAEGLQEGCTVTDAGSTKAQVMSWASEYLPPTVTFVGGHPMAGKETSGIEAAAADLFVGCTYCLVRGPGATREATDTVERLARQVGARALFIDAAEHDRLVAAVSHLPMLMSSALISMAAGSPDWPEMAGLAATGFRDITRLASGSPQMTRDICFTNTDSIVRWIDEYVKELTRFRHLVANGGDELEKALTLAREQRETWLRERR